MYCRNAKLIENGKFLRCNLDDNPCPYVRWCSVERKVKNSSSFVKCSKQNEGKDEMAKKKTKKKEMVELDVRENEIKEETKEENKNKVKICPVILAVQNKTIFSFDGYGVSYPNKFESEKLEVEYQGKIGQKDFKIIDVKEL